MKGTVTHADFYQVNLKEKIAAKVAIHFQGEAPAVREKGGVLNKTLAEVELEALPNDMPHSVDVDLSALRDIGDAIHVRDLTLPRGVESFIDADTVICSISSRVEEKEEPATVDVSAIKVEGEEKRKESEEE
jgi:large subunit ribosomal protein L25